MKLLTPGQTSQPGDLQLEDILRTDPETLQELSAFSKQCGEYISNKGMDCEYFLARLAKEYLGEEITPEKWAFIASAALAFKKVIEAQQELHNLIQHGAQNHYPLSPLQLQSTARDTRIEFNGFVFRILGEDAGVDNSSPISPQGPALGFKVVSLDNPKGKRASGDLPFVEVVSPDKGQVQGSGGDGDEITLDPDEVILDRHKL